MKKRKNIKNNTFDMNKEIIIGCPIHGDFFQKPKDHLAGFGCPICDTLEGKPTRGTACPHCMEDARKQHEEMHNQLDKISVKL